jgi:hypothetical protein
MVTDGQVSELRRWLAAGKSLAASARMASMDKKTARSYRDDPALPSQRKSPRKYRTRVDPFADVWNDVEQLLYAEPGLKAVTLFGDLQRQHPGKFDESTRRTFERRVANWRAIHGPDRPVFFPQDHHPGRFAASDFTVCNELGVKIAGVTFKHTLFHCVLTYSNIESVSLCFSESFEALSEGIQNAFWQFGGVPAQHRSDSLSAAVRNHSDRTTLTIRYAALMDHYGCVAQKTNARCANENGDVESQNGHIKDRIDQALLLRGSREFAHRDQYMAFVQEIIDRANASRQQRFAEERLMLGRLPDARLDTDDQLKGIRVSKSSTINIRANTYSVPSRLIGRKVDVRISAETITVTYQGYLIQTMQRLVGKQAASVNYRHVIDSLLRKPGAFADYRYREEMFPSSYFRFTYDLLGKQHSEKVADKLYLQILKLAADESQQAVEDILRVCVSTGEAIDIDELRSQVAASVAVAPATDIDVEPPDLNDFDCLIPTFSKDGTDDNNTETQVLTGTSQSGPEREQDDDQDGSEREFDDAVQGTADADVPGSVRPRRVAGRSGELELLGLSIGTDDAGMPSPTRGPDQATDDTVSTSGRQDVVNVRSDAITDERSSATGDASRGIVLGSPGEPSIVRQTGFWEEPCVVCVGGAVGVIGTQCSVHDVQLVSAATTDRQTGLATSEVDQAVFLVRGADHRRPGLRAAEPRGDGGALHAVGGAIRARQRAADEQSGVLEVGSDLQGRDDDGGSDRPLGASQRDHRAERSELPRGEGQASSDRWQICYQRGTRQELVAGNSNCR